ncbi:hypothetical protein [Streptomyces sp. NPDC047043]
MTRIREGPSAAASTLAAATLLSLAVGTVPLVGGGPYLLWLPGRRTATR